MRRAGQRASRNGRDWNADRHAHPSCLQTATGAGLRHRRLRVHEIARVTTSPTSGCEPNPSVCDARPERGARPDAGLGERRAGLRGGGRGGPIRLTGIVHAHVELTQGVQSFDSATAVAPTSAVNPAVLSARRRVGAGGHAAGTFLASQNLA
jgi:hypothetical protein